MTPRWLNPVLVMFFACGIADEPEVEMGAHEVPVLAADGDPCARHEECASGSCVPVLPAHAEQPGVCRGPAMSACVRVLGVDNWAAKTCVDLGMADAVCPSILTPEMQARCIVPAEAPSGDHPFPYVCCETTFFE